MHDNDVEAYVQICNIDSVIACLSASLGALTADEHQESQPYIYQNQPASVVIHESQDGYFSIWLKGTLPWSSCAQLGRYLARSLKCTVRCDPGSEFPEISLYSDVFLQIDTEKEQLVNWG